MKRLLLLFLMTGLLGQAQSQFVHKIKADSVLITNDSCTAELNLENSTKHIKGFLYNKGNGRTEFRKVVKLNDNAVIMGEDTLVLGANISNTSLSANGNYSHNWKGFNLIADSINLFSFSSKGNNPQYNRFVHAFMFSSPATIMGMQNILKAQNGTSDSVSNSLSANPAATLLSSRDFSTNEIAVVQASVNQSNVSSFKNGITLAYLGPGADSTAMIIKKDSILFKGIRGAASADSLFASVWNSSANKSDFIKIPASSLSIFDTNFGNTNIAATGNRNHNFKSFNLIIDSIKQFNWRAYGNNPIGMVQRFFINNNPNVGSIPFNIGHAMRNMANTSDSISYVITFGRLSSHLALEANSIVGNSAIYIYPDSMFLKGVKSAASADSIYAAAPWNNPIQGNALIKIPASSINIPRVSSTTSSSTITPNALTDDVYAVTALAENTTIAAPSGTFHDGQIIILRIKDNGAPRTISWNSIYRGGMDFSLPTSTVAGKATYITFIWNAQDSKLDGVGLSKGY